MRSGLHPIEPSLSGLAARAVNRAKPFAKDTTTDKDIVRRQFLLIDLDPKRPPGISATDAEHEAALQRAIKCRQGLRDLGWPDPMFNDSGNGAHLIYRIDLPNDAAANALVKGALNSLAAKWDDEAVTVDRSVHNAARIVKLPGTLAAKGDHTNDRPHRIARIVEAPERLECVSWEQLESVAGTVAVEPIEPGNEVPGFACGSFDLLTWLRKHNLAVQKVKDLNDGKLYELERCPWRPTETDGGAFVIQNFDGRLSAGCHHAKCQSKGWNELRDVVEPGWRNEKLASGEPLSAIEADDDPHRLARLYLDQHHRHPDRPTLVFWRGSWLCWRGGSWRCVPVEEIQAKLNQTIKAEFDRQSVFAQQVGKRDRKARKVTAGLLNNVLGALKAEVLIGADIEQPAWLDRPGPWPADEVLAARNGLIHLPSLNQGVFPPTPTFFSPSVLDCDFDINAPAPIAWLKFLRSVWPDDQQSIDTLQEFMGYLLTHDLRHHKILLVVGPTRSGKGVIGRVIKHLVGPNNVAAATFDSITTNFGLSSLLGKTVVIFPDARIKKNTPSNVLERLLSLSSGDPLPVDRKYGSVLSISLKVRLIIFSNELPDLSDASGAFASRNLLLCMERSWLGKEDIYLGDRLIREVPSILLWAIQGWQRLQKIGHFVQPKSANDLKDELHDLSSPVAAFVRECCVVGQQHSVARKDLYDAFVEWSKQRGHVMPMKQAIFGRDLRAVIPPLKDRQPTIDGKKERFYVGIALSP